MHHLDVQVILFALKNILASPFVRKLLYTHNVTENRYADTSSWQLMYQTISNRICCYNISHYFHSVSIRFGSRIRIVYSERYSVSKQLFGTSLIDVWIVKTVSLKKLQ